MLSEALKGLCYTDITEAKNGQDAMVILERAAGTTGYIKKPISKDVLAKRISEINSKLLEKGA